MKARHIKKICVMISAVVASTVMTSCAGWWVGSDGWGLTQPGPGGINIGVSGGWGALNPDPGPPPAPPQGPQGPPPGGGPQGPPVYGPY